MRIRLATLLALALLVSGCVTHPPETTNPRGDSIRFVARSGIVTANGLFHAWRVVDSRIDPDDLAASFVEIEIDVASIDTGFESRDDHLRDPDFLEVERWPKAYIRAFDVRPLDGSDDSRFSARVEIGIRDRRESMSGEFRLVSNRPLIIEGEIEIDRLAFGVGAEDSWWNPMSPRNEVLFHFRLTLE
jgi:polyisoprenoid-binding protein YceI